MEIGRVVLPCTKCHVSYVVWASMAMVAWATDTLARIARVGRVGTEYIPYVCIDCSKFAPIGTRQQFDAAAQALLQEAGR